MLPPYMVDVKHFPTLQGNLFLAFVFIACYFIDIGGGYNMWLDAIRRMKTKSGLTTSEIANQSGIPEPTLEKLFAGKVKDPKLPTMQKLVRFFGYTLDDLEDEKKQTKKAPAPPEGSTGAKIDPEKLQDMLIEYGFVKPGEDLSNADLRFLLSVGEIIRAWFAEHQ